MSNFHNCPPPVTKIRRKKCELKDKAVRSDTSVDTSYSLMTGLVPVVGFVNGQQSLQSPGLCVSKEKKKKLISPDHDNRSNNSDSKSHIILAKSSSDKPVKSSTTSGSRLAKRSADAMFGTRIGQIDSTGWKHY